MEVSQSQSVDVPNSMDEINSLEDMKLFEEELNSLEDIKSLDDMKPLDEIQSLGEQMDFKQEIVDSLTDPLPQSQQQQEQQQPQQQQQQQQSQHQPQQQLQQQQSQHQQQQLFPIIKDENVDNETVIECRQCGAPGNILSKLIQCSTCCKHFHAACAGAGAGSSVFNETNWNCTQCQGKCQICHQQTTEIEGGRALRCEECQKLYHATCMRPMMTSIPKFGWKCNQCRVCSDCGSRTPGAGISSRWHCHFTVCDSCYQQRNKGFSCPMCQRAYRAAAHKEMVKCSACNRFVHSTCDEAADLQQYHARKESNPDYDYVCPACKALPAKSSATLEERNDGPSTSSSGPSVSTGSSTSDTSADNVTKSSTGDLAPVTKCGPGKPGDLYKLVKKRLGRGGKFMPSKSSGTLAPISRKRGAPRGKGRNALIFADKIQQGLDRNGKDLDFLLSGGATDSKPIFISDKDEYMMTHDICVMCGSIGKGEDGILIGCAQCGQCYHPYCVNVKVNKVVLERGWRCLDCTICEGCGQKNDEARLILCDECDISYHIYCIEPPLETVPHGNWKCSWCAVCQQCGRKDSGKNSEWMNGFTECGPCASEGNCSVCSKAYVEDELIIECVNCERWLHGQCDGINTGEEAAVKCENDDYNCPLCRRLERLEMPPPTSANQQQSTDGATATPKNGGASPCVSAAQAEHNGKAEHWLDGVCVSEQGFQHIKSLSNEIKRKRKVQQRTPNEPQQQDFGIQATIESVVAAGADNNSSYDDNASNCQNESTADNKVTPPPNYKDGMPWTGAPDAAAPEGFSIFKNDAGVSILRKKRQRNLQKVGIGGFTVRNRAVKKEPLVEITAGGNAGEGGGSSGAPVEKKKKAARPKNRNKLIEAFPPYLQEAFFGKELLMNCKTDVDFWESDPETAEDELSKLEFTSGTIIKTEPLNSAPDSATLLANPTIKTEHIKTEAPSMPAENQQADADAYLVNTDEMHKQYIENMAQVPMEADHIKSETPDIQNSSTSSANLTNTTVMSSNTGANNSGVMDNPEMSFEPQSQLQTGALEAQVEAQAGPGPNMVENADMLH